MSWFEFEEQNSGNGGVGAIAGYNEGLIENVHVIQTELEGYADVGGIAGYNIGTITNASFKDGRISGQKAVGGLVGKSTGVLNTSYVKGTTISNEYQGICSDPSYNDQSSCVSNSQTWNGAMYFGGAIGQIIGCAAVTEASQVSVEAVVIGADRVGGFAGQIDSGITNCAYEDLRIDTFLMATSQNNSYAGGVFGEVISATAATVFGIAATGDIQAVYKYSDAGFVTATAANYVQINSGVLAFKNIAANTSLNTATHTNSNLAASFNIAYDLTNYAGINPVWQNTNQNFELPKLAIQPAEFCDGKHGLTFAGGNGSAASPYLICNIQQLLNLNQFLTAGANFKLLKNINLASVTNLRRNVFCNGEYLVGDLCSVGGAFSGSFDGNMKWLYGFVGTDSSPSFFNEISASGTVKNTFFFSNLSLPSIGIHFGMVAKKNSGVIENVHVFGSMQMNGTFGALRAGSVAAENFGRILGSSSHVVLEINRPGTVVGGFVGSNYGLIAYSRNYSTVYAADAAIAGGLVGTTGNNATSPFSYTDPITNNTYNVNKSVIYRIENDAHVKLMNSAGTTFSVAQKLGGVVGEALSGLFNDIDNRGSIVFKSAEYAGPHDYSIGPMTCTAPSNNVYRVSAAGTGNGYTWAAGDLAFCFEGQVFQCSNTADIFPETVTTTHYIPACLFGSFTARTGSSSVEISNNASNSDFNNIAAVYGLDLHGVNQSSTFYRSGYFVGSVSAGTIDNNLFANFPRFRVSNEIEKIYNGDGNSFNLYLHWITSGYHQAYPFAHTDTNTDNTVLTPVDLTTDIFTSDYILSAGQATRTVSTTAAGSLTLDAPTGYNLTDESLYFVDSAQISALSTVMGSYGFDVSEESADLDTTWYTRDTSDSYWVNTEDYEDIVYKDMYIDLYNQAINQ